MIHNDLSTQLQLLLKTSAPPLLEVSQQQLELPQLVPGQKVPAHVIANLPNGRFQVLIADKTLDMNLPRNTQPGDTLELAFVTARPRLTFVLASDLANAASTGNAANTASTVARPQVSLSETARFLGGLLEKITQPETRQAAASNIAQVAPLLSGAPAKTLDFAQALRGALTQSGLFYESHQAQWITGQRPLTDLLREPQGRLSPAAASLMQLEPGREKTSHLNTPLPSVSDETPASQNQHDALFSGKPLAVAQPPAMPETRAAELQAVYSPRAHGIVREDAPSHISTTGTPGIKPDEPQQTPVLPQNQNDVSSSGKPLASTQPAHPETLPIVRQQLEAIDSRQVMWQGQVWPGQTMEWQIEERNARAPGSEMIMPEWQTSLHLMLPQLGEISARLTLQPNGIRVQLDATDPASASLLAEQRTALQQGMASSGLQLVEMKVSHEHQEAAG